MTRNALPGWLRRLIQEPPARSDDALRRDVRARAAAVHRHIPSYRIEEQVRSISYAAVPAGLCAPARDTYLPIEQLSAFAALWNTSGQVPTQEAFLDLYWRVNQPWIERLSPAIRLAQACRVARNWASFVAEEQFTALCVESRSWALCDRSVAHDIKRGVDVLLTDVQGNVAGIRNLVGTPAARTFRLRKQRTLTDGTPLFDVELPFDRAHWYRTAGSGLHLYRRADVQHLKAEWDALFVQHCRQLPLPFL